MSRWLITSFPKKVFIEWEEAKTKLKIILSRCSIYFNNQVSQFSFLSWTFLVINVWYRIIYFKNSHMISISRMSCLNTFTNSCCCKTCNQSTHLRLEVGLSILLVINGSILDKGCVLSQTGQAEQIIQIKKCGWHGSNGLKVRQSLFLKHTAF